MQMQLQKTQSPLVTCMKYKDIYRAVVLSNQVYMNPKTYMWKNPKSYYVSKNNIDVFITPFDQSKEDSLYVVFKGASNIRDLLVSASAIPEKSHDIMHNAYMRNYLHVHKDILKIIQPMMNDYKRVIFTGHSKGSSESAAAILFNHIATDMNKNNQMSCITFGSPRCINKNVSTFFEQHIDHLCIEHCYDIIPHIPLHSDLVTLPNKLIIGNKNEDNPLRIYDNHSASKYRSLIEDLAVPCETPLHEHVVCRTPVRQPESPKDMTSVASHDDFIS